MHPAPRSRSTRRGARLEPQWEKLHARLPATAQAELRPFLTGVALARALEANDLAGLRRILLDLTDDEVANVPGAMNACAIIARLARLSRPAPATPAALAMAD